jgi:glycosyltransferase involved in cell wall biosynthesis
LINSKNQNNVAAIIPFFNERRTINQVISKTLPHVDCIIAVDDGSTDGSGSSIPESENVKLIKFSENKGKGAALKAGLLDGYEKSFENLVTLDADLQHNPDEIPVLVAELKNFNIVIGNRLNNLKGMPLHRRMSNFITSFLLSLKTGQKLIDSQCGFRAYNAEVIRNVDTIENGFEAESEMLIKATRKGFKIGFTEISTIYGDERSKMSPFKTTFGFIKLLFI